MHTCYNSQIIYGNSNSILRFVAGIVKSFSLPNSMSLRVTPKWAFKLHFMTQHSLSMLHKFLTTTKFIMVTAAEICTRVDQTILSV